jgi:hypothetical protein
MSATQRFHEVANDALVQISAHLWPGAKLCLVVYAEGKPDLDIVLKDSGISLDEVVSALRRAGLSIDGDNFYKRDPSDSVAGSMAFGYQNTNPPPEGHWAKRFWDMGRAEGEMREELTAALKLNRENLHACQATIHYAGGVDPAYVNDALAAMKVAEEILAKYPPLNPA